MQEPGSLMGPPPSPSSLRRQQQGRTAYRKEQQQQQKLETSFQRNKYPTYEEREALAVGLSLKGHQVQVWFKNRRPRNLGCSSCSGLKAREPTLCLGGPRATALAALPVLFLPAPHRHPAPRGPKFLQPSSAQRCWDLPTIRAQHLQPQPGLEGSCARRPGRCSGCSSPDSSLATRPLGLGLLARLCCDP